MMECYFSIRDASGEIVAECGPLPVPDLERAVRAAGWSILQSLRIHRSIAALLDEDPPIPSAKA